MTEVQKKTKNKKKRGMSPVVAGIAGVVAGGMAVAAAVMMSDKKNQKKAKEVWNGARGQVKKNVGKLVEHVKQKIEKKK